MRLLLDDEDVLLHAILRQHQLLRLAVLRYPLGERRLAVHGDESPLGVLALPARLHVALEGDEHTGDDGENDEEDAGAGVRALVGGRPVVAEEGRHGGALKDGRVAAAAVGASTVTAAAAAISAHVVTCVAHAGQCCLAL